MQIVRAFKLAFALIAASAPIASSRYAFADAYDPPPTYYNSATGTGAALMQQLETIMATGQNLPTYGDARTLLAGTDQDPNNPNNVLLFYNRRSVSNVWDPNSNNFGTREHVWPSSRRPDGAPSNSTRNIGSDLHILKPLDQSTNSSRGNDAFGTPTASGVNGHTNGYYYPGDADSGDTARIIFYGGTRWKDAGLKVVNGEGNPANYEMGDLASLIVWHFADPPDTFERRRNQVIYQDQGNRNAFIDHPEYAWSVYMNQMNDSQIAIAGTTPDANGGSVKNVDLGRVFVGSAVPAAQNFTLNKAGLDGTYFQVTPAGAATSSISGRYNAFRTNQTDSKSITIGLNTSTSTAGLRSGTVTIDNLDVTTQGGAGRGANDANDVFNVSLTVLDHANPSFTTSPQTNSLNYDFGTIAMGSADPTFNFDIFNLPTTPGYTANLDFDGFSASGDSTVLTTDLPASSEQLALVGGAEHQFTATFATTTVGHFTATYNILLSDENLPGAQNKSLTLTLTGQIAAALLPGDYDNDGVVDSADYIIWRKSLDTGTPLAYNETASIGVVDAQDYLAWRQNFGATRASGSQLSDAGTAVPEPATSILLLLGLFGTPFFSVRERPHVNRISAVDYDDPTFPQFSC